MRRSAPRILDLVQSMKCLIIDVKRRLETLETASLRRRRIPEQNSLLFFGISSRQKTSFPLLRGIPERRNVHDSGSRMRETREHPKKCGRIFPYRTLPLSGYSRDRNRCPRSFSARSVGIHSSPDVVTPECRENGLEGYFRRPVGYLPVPRRFEWPPTDILSFNKYPACLSVGVGDRACAK